MNKIVKIFKHAFIPHIHNDYKPHFFREISVSAILIVVVILLSISVNSKIYINKTNMTSAVLPAVLVDLTNQTRLSSGVPALERNTLLDEAARLKAEDMASYGYFAHTSPQGITPWHWFDKAGYYFVYAGENLAVDFTESVDVENAWLNSPSHKANILNSHFSEIGMATAEGYYEGSPTIYVVQMFGAPAIATSKGIAKGVEASPSPKVVFQPTTIKEKAPTPVVKKEEPAKEEPAKEEPAKEELIAENKVVEQVLEIITETNEFISVKNTAAKGQVLSKVSTGNSKYSKFQERLVFNIPKYTDKVYRVFIWMVLIALVIMMLIEVRRQHPKNIMYGILLIVIIFCFIYINQAMFVTNLLI